MTRTLRRTLGPLLFSLLCLTIAAPNASALELTACGVDSSSYSGYFAWHFNGVRDPFHPSAYFLAGWEIVTNYSLVGGGCVATSEVCTIVVNDALGTGQPLSVAKVKWIRGELTELTGKYQGIPFTGSSAPTLLNGPGDTNWCSAQGVHLEGQVVPVTLSTGEDRIEVLPVVGDAWTW